MDKPTSQKWRSFTPARSGKMVHYCSGDWRSFAPALTYGVFHVWIASDISVSSHRNKRG
jgi:hypothetical protein